MKENLQLDLLRRAVQEWSGYGRERPSGRDAQVRRIFYLAYEVLKYIVIRIARQGDRPGAKRYHSMGRELLGQL